MSRKVGVEILSLTFFAGGGGTGESERLRSGFGVRLHIDGMELNFLMFGTGFSMLSVLEVLIAIQVMSVPVGRTSPRNEPRTLLNHVIVMPTAQLYRVRLITVLSLYLSLPIASSVRQNYSIVGCILQLCLWYRGENNRIPLLARAQFYCLAR